MLRIALLGSVSTLLAILLLYAGLDTPSKVSPQGCRMSYMMPSYILQTGMNSSWSSLASRYSLWLYREVGLDPDNELRGLPVLFIPGNAGSSRQVRSIASSASRQYHTSSEFAGRGLKPLDFFAVDFNEDLSAFHGPTLEAERRYTAAAVNYILTLYPPDTKIIVMGHSMGGIVGVSFLPSDWISAIITMSTPHSVPPARFDSRMDHIYATAQNVIDEDATPILSICGGITDTMIPSEFCNLPEKKLDSKVHTYRKTVFTSALEGCWTGVGHREMVWCHQVRWRVARAALELGAVSDVIDKSKILDRWFQDGLSSITQTVPDENTALDLSGADYETLPEGMPFVMKEPTGSHVYLMPIPNSNESQFSLFLSDGSIPPISAAHPGPFSAEVYLCRQVKSSASEKPSCRILPDGKLKLIPNPSPEEQFPIPHEGVDESEGVVAFSAIIKEGTPDSWIAVKVRNEGRKGWVAARFEEGSPVVEQSSRLVAFLKSTSLHFEKRNLVTHVQIPSWLTSVLLVYRVIPEMSSNCEGALLPPILLHTSGTSEAHYHRLQHKKPVLLHGHSSAPFVPLPEYEPDLLSRGLNFTIYSTGECGVSKVTISIDWWNSFGRLGARYWNAILAWGAGVISVNLCLSMMKWDAGNPMPKPGQGLHVVAKELPKVMVLSTAVALVPLSTYLYLGNSGEPLFALIAPFILVVSTGLVCFTWMILSAFQAGYGIVCSLFPSARQDSVASRGRSLTAMAIMSILVFLFVPWQVAFLACYLLHFHVCATETKPITHEQHDAHAQKLHVLLLMTWCLPILAPVLAVWVRTLLTAGLTSPFDGDHFVLNMIAFMYLTYIMSTTREGFLRRRHRFEFVPVPYIYAFGAVVTLMLGPRSMYRTYEALNWPTIALVCFRAVPNLWR